MSKSSAAGINPVATTYGTPQPSNSGSTAQSIPHPPPISSCTHHIAGILVTVFGMDELPPDAKDVAVLWLLHPRLQTQECMAPFAAHIISEYNDGTKGKGKGRGKGLIAVSFDQRNHGTRLVSAIANEAWRGGNEHHAPDMFSCYAGTAMDTSLLLDYLPGYIFPDDREHGRRIVMNLVMGISLGGHAAWHLIMADARFSAAIVTIGCPDYARLMGDRARLSKRRTWLESEPHGATFFGSRDFPPSLMESVRRFDPAGVVWGLDGLEWRDGQEYLHTSLSEAERRVLMPVMSRCFANKRILNLSGGADKLVPYKFSEPFVGWLKAVSGKGGFFEGSGFGIEDLVFEGVGHEVPGAMVGEMSRFVRECVEDERVGGGMAMGPGGGAVRSSKI